VVILEIEGVSSHLVLHISASIRTGRPVPSVITPPTPSQNAHPRYIGKPPPPVYVLPLPISHMPNVTFGSREWNALMSYDFDRASLERKWLKICVK